MALLRNLSWLFVLAIALFTITVPVVRAQTTSITNLQAASRVLVAHETHITFRVSYSTGTTGVALGTGIADADTAGEV